MKRSFSAFAILCFFAIPAARSQSTTPLKLVQTIPLQNVEGYFDHMAIDIKGQRLFVPGEHQRTIEVIDLCSGKDIRSISGFGGDPRKTIYLPETNEIWVDDGDATVKAFGGDTYELTKNIPLTGHDLDKDSRAVPDNGVYDPIAHLFYLGARADGLKKEGVTGSVEIVDVKNGKFVGSIALTGLVPTGLALDPSSPKMFVAMGDTNQVVVIDRDKRAIIATWPTLVSRSLTPLHSTPNIIACLWALAFGARILPSQASSSSLIQTPAGS
jgi:DNA-binding beta-propeller fold protein YncE